MKVMIGRLRSTHRSLEFILVLTGIGYCFGIPLHLLWKKRSYWQGHFIPFGIGHVAAIIFFDSGEFHGSWSNAWATTSCRFAIAKG